MQSRFEDKPLPTRGVIVGFAVASAIAVAAVALVIGNLLRSAIRQEAIAGAQTSAALFSKLALPQEEYRDGRITLKTWRDLDADVRASTAVRGARLWDRERRVVYNGGEIRSAATLSATDEVRAAFEGRKSAEVTTAGGDGELIAVTLPVRYRGDRGVERVLQVYVDYSGAERSIGAETRSLYLILAFAALLGFCVLLPLVNRAAHALAEVYARRHRRLRTELSRALRQNELELHYQPKLDLASGELLGAEALLRWRHPRHGMVPPLEYLPLAEEAGLMGPLTLHVLELALEQSARWREQGLDLRVAVNLSADNLQERELPRKLARMLDRHGVPAEQIVLEITETAAMEDCGLEVLEALHGLSVELSIDDFGTGYSSLARLPWLPFDEVKIDRRFVSKIGAHGIATMLDTIIRLGHQLDLRVVAEGVESEDVAERLRALDCDAAQGFWLSRPLPAEQLERWIAARPPALEAQVAAG